MKKSNFMVMFLVALFLVAGAGIVQAEDKVDMTGTWNVDVKLESGTTGSPIFVLKQDGDKLTGTYKGYFGESPVTGTIKGQDLEIKFGPSGQEAIYKGKSDGKKMSGDIDLAGQDKGKFTGKKEKKS